jgi:hypothetical protein
VALETRGRCWVDEGRGVLRVNGGGLGGGGGVEHIRVERWSEIFKFDH